MFMFGPLLGVMRCAAYSGAKSIALHVPELDPMTNMTKEQYETQTVNKTGCAVNHSTVRIVSNNRERKRGNMVRSQLSVEKLFRLRSLMRTKRGREMAEERDRFMREFVARVEKEYEMQL